MGLAPEKASTVIPAQSVNEKLTLVAGLIPDPSGYRHNGKQKLYLRMLCCATWIWDQVSWLKN
jgi:hypothetical protein